MSYVTSDPKAHALSPCGLLARALFATLFFAAAFTAPAGAASAQTVSDGSPDLVISQVYTRGGEPGAAFRNDFVEIFNRGNADVNLADYSLLVLANVPPSFGSPGGLQTFGLTLYLTGNNVAVLQPGQYLLVRFGSGGGSGAPLPAAPDRSPSTEFFNVDLPGDFGRVAITRGASEVIRYGCAVGTDAALVDFFSYGSTTCAEGPAVFTAPTAITAAVRNGDGCADTDSNVSDFATVAPNPRNSQSAARPCNRAAPAVAVQFEAAETVVSEGAGSVEIFVTRTGVIAGPASVQYATADEFSSDRKDYATTFGTLDFAAGETRKSFRVLIADDTFAEPGPESFYVGLAYPTAAALGARHIMRVKITDDDATAGANPINTTDFFVAQHYRDFLSRAPDPAGLQFWTQEIESCGADLQCREVKRINVSAAFFLSIEFQETGYFAYRAYKAAFPDGGSRVFGFPTYRELWRDAQHLGRGVTVNQGDWQGRLAANRQAFIAQFVTRPEFLIRYPASLTPAEFVDLLNTTAGSPLSQAERDQQFAELTAEGNTSAGRARVLRRVIDDSDFRRAEFNRAFVLMEYFGYLRRNPYAQPDTDFGGYDFWLGKLNQFDGDFVRAEMVKAFISSIEYRHRFAL